MLTDDYRAATVQRRAASHSQATVIVPGRPIAWCHTAHGRDVARQWERTIPATIEDIIRYFYPVAHYRIGPNRSGTTCRVLENPL
jgi:hypothetical protein